MQARINIIWLVMLLIALSFSLLYLWFTLFPGQTSPEILKYFSTEQIRQGQLYSRMFRLLYIVSFGLNVLLLLWLVFGKKAATLSHLIRQITSGNYWGSILLFSIIIWIGLTLIQIPFTFLSGFYWQHRWGFSTQPLGGWWIDYFKSFGIEMVIYMLGVLVFFWILNHFPKTWWLAGAVLFSLWLIIQMYIWPAIVSPLFNSFTPVEDPKLVSMIQELAQEADLPIDQVLVMDASRRTTRANAYFTGLGRTKRIVLYDTLLNNYPLDEVKAVVAHEMAHWRQGHIVQGLGLGIAGSFLLWGFLYVLLHLTIQPGMYKSPHVWVVVLLFFSLVSFIGSPLQNYISRGMEREADRVAVELTGDATAAVRLQINLAQKNMSDVAPHAFIQWFSYSHPAALNRIVNIQQSGN